MSAYENWCLLLVPKKGHSRFGGGTECMEYMSLGQICHLLLLPLSESHLCRGKNQIIFLFLISSRECVFFYPYHHSFSVRVKLCAVEEDREKGRFESQIHRHYVKRCHIKQSVSLLEDKFWNTKIKDTSKVRKAKEVLTGRFMKY